MVKCAQRTCIEIILKSTETSKSFSRAEPEIKRDVNDTLDIVRRVKKQQVSFKDLFATVLLKLTRDTTFEKPSYVLVIIIS